MSLKRIRIPLPPAHALLTAFVALCFFALSLALPSPHIARGAVGQVYLPNITKTLGGAAGWTTPIAVQNTGQSQTDVTLTFYRFSDGKPAGTVTKTALLPGQSWTFDPRTNASLPDDTQFSTVVQATNGQVAVVVIEGSGSSWMAYSGTTTGGSTVYLPNITRNLGGRDGWNTPFIVQNLGTTATTATVSFYNFSDGTLAKKIDNVKLEPGRSQPFLTWAIDGLADDRQYAVVVEGPKGSQLYAVVNESSGGMAMSYEGLLTGSDVVYLPNVLKYLGGRDHWSTPFIVQNIGTQPAIFALEFYSFDSGQLVTQVPGLLLQPGRSLPVDVRFTPATLPAGSYSVVVRGQKGSQLGAVVNEVELSAGMAMSYDGIAQSQALQSVYLPMLERNVGAVRWSSPIVAQNLGTAAADITLTLFDANGAVATQKVFPAVKPGAAAVFDPRYDRRLKDGTYSGLVQSSVPITAIVNVSGDQPGDYAMAFAGTAGNATQVPALAASTKQVGPYLFTLHTASAADVYVESTIDAAAATRITFQTDADVTQVQTDFGRQYAQIPTLYVFATTESYKLGLQKLLGYSPASAAEIARDSDALFHPKTQLIVANWGEIAKYQPQSGIRHELTHAMNSQIIGTNPTLPAWLDEGLAFNEEQTMPGAKWITMTSRYSTASMASTGTLIPLVNLTSPQLWSMRDYPASTFQYYEAGEAVRMLRADLGNVGVVRILELMGQGQTFDAAYAAVAGKPFSEFVAAFPERAKALAPASPGIASVEDSPGGPGMSFILYGYAPISAVVIEVRSSTAGDVNAELTTLYGTRFHWLGPSWPAATYNITVTTPTGSTTSLVARKV